MVTGKAGPFPAGMQRGLRRPLPWSAGALTLKREAMAARQHVMRKRTGFSRTFPYDMRWLAPFFFKTSAERPADLVENSLRRFGTEGHRIAASRGGRCLQRITAPFVRHAGSFGSSGGLYNAGMPVTGRSDIMVIIRHLAPARIQRPVSLKSHSG